MSSRDSASGLDAQEFYGILVQHFATLAGRSPLDLPALDSLAALLVAATAEVPFYAATVARARLARFQQRLSASLAAPTCAIPEVVPLATLGTHEIWAKSDPPMHLVGGIARAITRVRCPILISLSSQALIADVAISPSAQCLAPQVLCRCLQLNTRLMLVLFVPLSGRRTITAGQHNESSSSSSSSPPSSRSAIGGIRWPLRWRCSQGRTWHCAPSPVRVTR